MPFNITPAAKEGWNNFIKETLNGNPRDAFDAYHKYCLAKEEAFKRRQPLQDKGLEM